MMSWTQVQRWAGLGGTKLGTTRYIVILMKKNIQLSPLTLLFIPRLFRKVIRTVLGPCFVQGFILD